MGNNNFTLMEALDRLYYTTRISNIPRKDAYEKLKQHIEDYEILKEFEGV